MEMIRYIESIPSNQCFSWLSHRKESSLKLSEVLNILCKGISAAGKASAIRGAPCIVWEGISRRFEMFRGFFAIQ